MRIPLAQHTYELDSLPLSAQRLINYYYEPAPEETKTGGALLVTPGLKTFASVGDGPIWGAHTLDGLLYVVSGDNVFTVNSSGGATDLGTIGTVADVVIMADNGTHVNIVKEDGASYNATASTLAQITDVDFPSVTSVTVLNFYGTICATFPQATASTPSPTTPKPTIAPTIACVVETGRPKRDATISSVPAEASAASIPYRTSSGFCSTRTASSIPLRTVLVTWPPARKAPVNSSRPATRTAPVMVSAPDPTLVPIAFATSFAPIAQAM